MKVQRQAHGWSSAGRTILRLGIGCLALLPGLLLAQADGAAAAEAPVDFRGKVTLAYGLVVGCIILFVVLSARRNAAIDEDIEFLERRVDALERNGEES